jgi:putative flippase GtrA
VTSPQRGVRTSARDRPPEPVATRMVRSVGVGVATTILTNAVLVALSVGLGVRAGLANVIGTICGIGPSYAWNRRYVWRLRGPSDIRRQVIPFWTLSLVGLVVSTVAADKVGTVGARWAPGVRAVALPAANLAVFATLWLVQFLVLDRVLFRRRTHDTTIVLFSPSSTPTTLPAPESPPGASLTPFAGGPVRDVEVPTPSTFLRRHALEVRS